MAEVHATALVERGAELAEDVSIGPFCVVGPRVRLGRGVRLESHVVITGRTTLGPDCRVFPFACLGHRPQDLKFAGAETVLTIGAGKQIREHVTMHPGTEGGGGVTEVGDHGLFMAAIHVAHDCRIGNRVIMANNATLGGHVTIQDEAILGGVSAVHQFTRIGRQAMVGGLAAVENDVIPYGMVLGNRARLVGLNMVGLKRRGAGRDELHALRGLYRFLFHGDGAFRDRLGAARERWADQPKALQIIGFIEEAGARGVCLPDRRAEA